MIAIGKWSCNINTLFYKGEVLINVFDENGKYGFDITAAGVDVPQIRIKSVIENGNTIDAVIEADALPGQQIPLHAVF